MTVEEKIITKALPRYLPVAFKKTVSAEVDIHNTLHTTSN